MSFRHYIFDLDGTLVDSHSGIAWAAQQAIERELPGAPAIDFRSLIGPPIRDIFRRALPAADALLIERLAKHYRRFYDDEGCRRAAAFPQAHEVLGALRQSGATCFVATNKPSLPTRRMLEHLGLISHFVAVISPDGATTAHHSKTEMVQVLIAQHALPAASTLVIGDSDDDAAAAAACGTLFAAAAYGYGTAARAGYSTWRTLRTLGDLLPIPAVG